MVRYRKTQIENIGRVRQELDEIAKTLSPIIRESNSRHVRLFKPGTRT